MSDSHEIIDVQTSTGMSVGRDPNLVLSEAKKAAEALMTVVNQKKNPVIMNGEKYLEFEDWQTVAQFYGLSAKVLRTNFVDFGGVRGYEATAECIRNSDGMVLSSADAMCLNDEDKWSTRTKYEYKDILDGEGKKIWVPAKGDKKGYYKSEKVVAGTVPVPLFQLRSMAQTRACAKVLRNKLAWVVVLAGFKPTVAEEMTGDEPAQETVDPLKAPQATATHAEDAIVYMDIFTMLQGTKGAKLNVIAYAKSVSHQQRPKKDKSGTVEISEYSVQDLAQNPTTQAIIKVFGLPLTITGPVKISFHDVEVGEYNGKIQYTAREAVAA